MASSVLLKEIKGVVNDVIDNNGNFRTIPIGVVGERKISTSRLKLLQSFLGLLKDTHIICEETKCYIFNKYITLKGVADELNSIRKPDEKPVNINTTQSKINYDKGKIQRLFSDTIISDIVLKVDNEDKMREYTAALSAAYIKYFSDERKDLRENIGLNLDRGCICTELDDERFDNFVKTIMPYLKSHMDNIAKSIDPDCVGYFNFLLSSPLLTEVDKKRASYLKQILSPLDNIEDAFDI